MTTGAPARTGSVGAAPATAVVVVGSSSIGPRAGSPRSAGTSGQKVVDGGAQPGDVVDSNHPRQGRRGDHLGTRVGRPARSGIGDRVRGTAGPPDHDDGVPSVEARRGVGVSDLPAVDDDG